MEKEFEIAQQAMASLLLYARHFASSEGYQKHKAEVIALVDVAADQFPGGGQFLKAFAQALRAS